MADRVIEEIEQEVSGCVREVAAARAGDNWTALPIVYDRTITAHDTDSIRLELDQSGSARLTYRLGGNVTTLYTDDETLRDLEHLILRGLNHCIIEQQKGWAA